MRKRINAFILSLAMLSSLCVVSMPVKAVAGEELLFASAVSAFLGASGIRLWREMGSDEDGAGDQLIDDVKTLWQDFKSGFNGDVPTWEAAIGRNGVEVVGGKFIYDYDSAQTMQSFANWLKETNTFTPNNNYPLTDGTEGFLGVIGPVDSSLYPDFANAPSPLYYYNFANNSFIGELKSSPWSYWQFELGQHDAPVFVLPIAPSQPDNQGYFSRVDLLIFSTAPFQYVRYKNKELTQLETSSSRQTTFTNNGQKIYYDIGTPSFRGYINFDVQLFGMTYNDYIAAQAADMFYNHGGLSESSSLIGTIGNTIADLVYPLVEGQSLAVDYGLGEAASADDLIDAAIESFVTPAEEDLVITAPIATPVPIDGAEELYPQPVAEDIVIGEENVSFADIGQALTTRFPFCIPWDFSYLFDTLIVPAKPIKTRVDIIPASYKIKYGISQDTSFELDLTTSDWVILRKLIAWGFLFGACGELILLTKHLVWVT